MKDLYTEVTNSIIDLLNTQLNSWDQPWIGLGGSFERATNMFSETPYRGINPILLSISLEKQKFRKNIWATFNQVSSNNGQVLKGQKGTKIVYFTLMGIGPNKKRYNNAQLQNMDDTQIKQLKIDVIPILKYYVLFNIEQTKGLEPSLYEVPKIAQRQITDIENEVDILVKNTGAIVIHKESNSAFYNVESDEITMPLKDQFKSAEGYIETIFHELGHYTSKADRCDRPMKNLSKSELAMEEIIAELTAAQLCAEFGITKTISNNASYIQSWIKELGDNPKFIFKAAREAQKASDYIMSFKA